MIHRILIACIALSWCLFAQSPPPPVIPDAQIESQIREKLAKSVIGKDGFTVRVKGGVVYWEGSTSIAQHKGAATRMAKSSGARRVVNNIRVSGTKKPKAVPAPAPSAKPGAEIRPSTVPAPGPAKIELRRAEVRWVPVRH